MASIVRWGIMGTGTGARRFAEALRTLPEARLTAVGSRSRERADAFGKQHNIPLRFPSCEGLVNCSEVDVVYVGTPHGCHHEHMMLALSAGKPVLCEKPFTVHSRHAEEVIKLARKKNLLLMEAMPMRFLPIMQKLRELLDQEVIGQIRMLTADFGYAADDDPSHWLFDPAMGGGALLDIGVYPLSLASMVMGAPVLLTGMADVGLSGVDKQVGAILMYPGGELSVIHASLDVNSFHEATILGTKGRIKIQSPWWLSTWLTVQLESKKNENIEAFYYGNGYQHEIVEFMKCLRSGLLESTRMPLDESLSIVKTTEALRAEWGQSLPGDAMSTEAALAAP